MAETLAQKFITVVMPVCNEEKFIAETIGMLLAQDYPAERFEIIVADGMSDDRTREIVSGIALENPQVILLDNPKRRSSSGRNVGFKAGKGAYFLVVDGHCHIPSNKLLSDINVCFQKSGAGCLGRPQPLDPPELSVFQRLVALTRASWLGHGAGSLIYSDYEGFASPTSNGAAYCADVFEQLGYVDETFDACEDVEFNYRVEKAGIKCFMSPRLTVRYFPRENFVGLFRQMKRYGLGRVRLAQKHPAALSAQVLAPAVLVSSILLLLVSLLFFPASLITKILVLVCASYAALVFAETVRLSRKNGFGNIDVRVPAIFLTIHSGLGWGLLVGASRILTSQLRKYSPSRTIVKSTEADRKIKIFFVIDRIASPTAGTEVHLTRLIRRIDKERFEPYLCVLQSTPWSEAYSGCPVYTVGVNSFKEPITYLNILRFSSFMRREAADIVQTYFSDGNKVGSIAGRLAGVRSIISTRRNQGYWHNRTQKMWLKILKPIALLFLANSEDTRRWAIDAEDLPPEKVLVIPNAVELPPSSNNPTAMRKAAREAWGFSEDEFVVGIVANLRPIKRVDLFLRTAALVSNEIDKARFVIIGEGEERAKLEALAANLNIADKVTFMGRVQGVSKQLHGFDVGVLTSDSESSSNAVLEYMAASLPVVATDVGALNETIVHGEIGFLVGKGDVKAMAAHLLQLHDPSVACAMGRRGAETIAVKFDAEKVIKSFEALYLSLAADNSKDGMTSDV